MSLLTHGIQEIIGASGIIYEKGGWACIHLTILSEGGGTQRVEWLLVLCTWGKGDKHDSEVF